MPQNDQARTYFEILADLGVTKHYGSLEATRNLVKACRIKPEKLVLDIGCGVGATPAYLVKSVGCRVVGLDLIESMLVRANRITSRLPAAHLAAFLAADARNLPFPDDFFDAVIMESVNVFFDDKAALFPEYIRITKPAGFVGLTEMTWLREPSQKLVDLFQKAAFVTALDEAGWIGLLKGAGLENVAGSSRQIDLAAESKGRMERYGYWYVCKTILNTLRLLVTSKKHRAIFQDGTSGLSKDVLQTVGYGIYAGQKPAPQ
jgi:ubiquinone/menaquinone biosynthesis C-methylase UbiE